MFKEEIIGATYMRHILNDRIVYRDANDVITCEKLSADFYRHHHVAEASETKPLPKSLQPQLEKLMELERQSHGILDAIQLDGDNIVFALQDEPGSLFQASITDFARISCDADLAAQLYNFTQPRGPSEPYSIQFENGDMVIY